ncbi:class I SAM-dependent methyltransferase [Actinomadura roseirufa]|uniref:class I SAM-dependent methyltransferase n=1 Tax=Actinomadura roseirufa TaxID=2094049 RepID=UPI00104118D0|nr:class I SAM-dependent methyltransferase [Actinomadura roseirufa]
MTSAATTSATSYKSAQAHYLSPKRRDPVKRLMEEPASRAVLTRAVTKLDLPAEAPLRVLDLGSGTGDGIHLLTATDDTNPPVIAGNRLDYVGLDGDADMVRTASSLHPSAAFIHADMRGELPDNDFDLYLSCGVPYSHLTPSETIDVLTGIFTRARTAQRRTAVIVDVLGRFSIEWTPQWQHHQWDYAMTFFHDAPERVQSPMTFYSCSDLTAVIAAAARAANVRPRHLDFTDRSVLVGRHTTTRTFNADIQPYRQLINDLAEGTPATPWRRLRFEPPTAKAPSAITQFFRDLSSRWNAQVDRAGAHLAPHQPVPGTQGPLLARTLLECERRAQQGLGAAHSLIATIVIDPA